MSPMYSPFLRAVQKNRGEAVMFPFRACKRPNNLEIRPEILDELLRDPEWNRKFENAKTTVDVARVVAEFCRARGYEVKL